MIYTQTLTRFTLFDKPKSSIDSGPDIAQLNMFAQQCLRAPSFSMINVLINVFFV